MSGNPLGNSGKRRGMAWLAAGVILVVCLVSGGAWLNRDFLLKTVIIQVLRGQGVESPSLYIDEFTVDRIILTDIRLGTDLQARRVDVDYTFSELLNGGIHHVIVGGLVVDVSTRQSGTVGLIIGRLNSTDSSAPGSFTMPQITLSDFVVHSVADGTSAKVHGDASIQPDLSGRISVVFEAALGASDDRQSVARGKVQADLAAGLNSATIAMSDVNFEWQGNKTAAGNLSLYALVDQQTNGRTDIQIADAEVSVAGDGRAFLVSNTDVFVSWMPETENVDYVLAGMTITDQSPERILSSPVIVSGRGAANPDAVNGTYHVEYGLGAVQAQVSVTHEFESRSGQMDTDIAPVVFSADGLQPDDLSSLLAVPAHVAGQIATKGRLAWNDGEFIAGATANVNDLAVHQGVMEFRIPSGRMHMSESIVGDPIDVEVRAENSSLQMGGFTFDLRDTSVRAVLEPMAKTLKANLAVLSVTEGSDKRVIEPFTVMADFAGDDAGLDFGVNLTMVTRASDGSDLNIQGRHSLRDGSGGAAVQFTPQTFSAGGASPAYITSLFDLLTNVQGHLNSTSDISWSPEGFDGVADINLDGFDFSFDTNVAHGMNAHIHFDQLYPLHMNTVQEITLDRIDSVVPFHTPVLQFRLLHHEGSVVPDVLLVHHASVGVSGGRLVVNDAVIDRTEAVNSVTLGVRGIDLAQVLGTLGMEGVTGDGILNGAIPLDVGVDNIWINNGVLEAAGPGVLKIYSAAAVETLSRGGSQAELLIQVLEDFHYEKLALYLNKKLNTDAEVRLYMEGANPAVKDGHPIILDINLSADLDKILGPLIEAYRLSDHALKAAVRGVF